MRVPRNKAVWIDEILVEALQINPSLTSNVICSIWKRWRELRYLIKPWAIAEMIPLYKSGNPEEPSSFRPIALLSQAREAIEGEVARMMTKKYSFRESQLSFQRETGTETAISRHIANSQRMKF